MISGQSIVETWSDGRWVSIGGQLVWHWYSFAVNSKPGYSAPTSVDYPGTVYPGNGDVVYVGQACSNFAMKADDASDGCKDHDSEQDDCGMPVWEVSEPQISLWLRDEPLGYQPALGSRISFRLSYKQRESSTGNNPKVFNIGKRWNCSWLSSVSLDAAGRSVVHFPGGGERTFSSTNDYLTNTRITGNTTNGFAVWYGDGRRNEYELVVTNGSGAFQKAFLTATWDAQGRKTQLTYAPYTPSDPVIRLQYVIDGDGLTNSIFYAASNSFSTNLISMVVDPYGRATTLAYDSLGRLTNIVDVAGISSSLRYDTNVWITNLTTPYGTTRFTYTDSPATNAPYGRSVLVQEPNGGSQLYFATNNAPGVANDYSASEIPSTAPLTNSFDTTNLNLRTTFHWGPRQYEALSTTNLASFGADDFRKAWMREWLSGPVASIGNTLSMERAPSPDGASEGQKIWYDYAGKPNTASEGTQVEPLFVAMVLPDGTTRFAHSERNTFGAPTRLISTYSLATGTVALRTNTFEYAANEIDLIRHTGPDGELQAGYAYNTHHQVLRLTNALEEVTAFTYNGDGQLTSVKTPAGLTTTNLYYSSGDYEGWLDKTIDLEINRTNTYTYLDGLVYTHTDERGLTLTNTWDALQRLRRVDFPDGTFVTNAYNALDRIQTVDRMGFTNSFGYDSMRRLTDVTNALGAVTHYEYCTCGSLESVTDALNNTTTYYRDNLSRATNIIYPGNISVLQEFNLLGQLVRTTDAWGSETNSYNNQGLLVGVSNAFGQVSKRVYDIEDRVVESVDANGVSVDMTYDDLGRVLTRTYPDTGVESFGYGATGLIRYTNQLGKVTRYGNDAAGRRVAETNANNEVVSFTYSPAGDLLTLTDGKDHVTTWDFDDYGRVISKVDHTDTEILRLDYDPNGRLTNRWTAAKGDTRYTYDAVGNLKGVDYPVTEDISLSYDAVNRLTNMVDGVGTTKYTYTAFGAPQSEDGPWADDTVTLTYQAGLRSGSSLQQPSASAWAQTYGHDSAKRLTSVTSPAGTFTYTLGGAGAASSLIRKLSLPGGSYITNGFDSAARLLFTDLKNSSSTVLNSHHYGYNAGNQRTQQVFTAGNFVNYAYDEIGQLKTALGKETDGTSRLHEQLGYSYDDAGNLSHRTNNALVQTFNVNSLNELTTATHGGTLTVAGTTTSAATNVTVNGLAADIYDDHAFAKAGFAVTNGLNSFAAVAQDSHGRMDTNSVTVNLPASVTFEYDANGNLTNDGQRVFFYDDENQLTTVLVSGEWKSEFEYDGRMRRRIRREYTWSAAIGDWQLTGETRYLYDGMLVIQERDGSNLPQATYTRGTDLSGSMEGAGGIGGLLARTDHSTTSSQLATAFYQADGSGNVTALVNAGGLIVAKYSYDPYGNTLSASGPLAEANLYRFSSKEWHDNAGLYYYGYRYYEPNLQRWLNRDPIGEWGGVNLYNYVGNDPVDYVDPFGLEKGAELLMRMNNGYGGLNPLFGKIWNAPNTAIGLVWGGLGIPFGAKPSFGNNSLQFENHPFMWGGDITLGNVICYRKGMGSKDPLFPGSPYNYGDHERQHTKQGEQLGPLFFPAYGIFGVNSLLHGNDFFGPGNRMEYGPYLPETQPHTPPRPWP